jgi:hypothetical protein
MKKLSTPSKEFRGAFPVIRIDYNKRLVNANLTAMPLLGDWKCRKGSKIPQQILTTYSEIESSFTNKMPSTCKVSFGDLQIWFDIVPFPEAGYIGMYGYHIEAMVADTKPEKLRMAS